PLVFGLGSALVTMVGTNMGAGHRARALRIALVGGAMAFAITETIGLVAALWPAGWMGLFTRDPDVVAVGSQYLRVVGPSYGFFGLGLALYFASQGAARRAATAARGDADRLRSRRDRARPRGDRVRSDSAPRQPDGHRAWWDSRRHRRRCDGHGVRVWTRRGRDVYDSRAQDQLHEAGMDRQVARRGPRALRRPHRRPRD